MSIDRMVDPANASAMVYMGKNLAGTEVTIVGLKGRPELNDSKGTMLDWHPESERWMVNVAKTGENLRLRFDNVQFPTGAEYEAEQAGQQAMDEEHKARVEAAVASTVREAPADTKPPPGWAAGEQQRAEWRVKETARLELEKAEKKAKAEAKKAAEAEAEAAKEEEGAELAVSPSFLSMGWLLQVLAGLFAWMRALLGLAPLAAPSKAKVS